METRVKKWGNSLALRIPRAFAAEAGIESDDAVELTFEAGNLVVKPLLRQELRLDELLAQVTVDNLHEEIDPGPAVGNESW